MKNKQMSLRLLITAMLFAMAAFITSCKKDADPIAGEVSQTVSNESSQDSQQDEADDISTGALNKSDPQGRVLTGDDERIACAFVTFEASATPAERLSGTLTIDFDKNASGDANPEGCTDVRGNGRKGKIVITWTGGRWFHVGSVITITLTDYSINGVVINGTRTLTNITSNVLVPTWTVVGEATITWPDLSTATRTVNKTKAWDIVAGTVTVTQTGGDPAASGTTRRNVSYTMEITAGLVFKLSCIATSKVYIPVSGTKVITFKNKTVTIDFGSGDCDNKFTVTLNGKTETFTASNDSSN